MLKSFKLSYLPLMLIYFAYGADGFSQIAETFYIKDKLGITPEELIIIGVWAALPWTIKFLFGHMVDSVPILGSQRKIYVFIGAGFMALGALLLAGLAGDWHSVMALGDAKDILLLSLVTTSLGLVIQDVVADAMTAEVIEREGKTDKQILIELGMVQVLGRLSLSLSLFIVAGLGAWAATNYEFETVALLSLGVPVISVMGAIFSKSCTVERSDVNMKFIYAGIAFAIFSIFMGMSNVPFAQEIVFIGTALILGYLLSEIIQDIDESTRKKLLLTFLVVFIYRAVPSGGPGIQWWMIDVLGFDQMFFGYLAQIGTVLALVGLWLGSKIITEKPLAWTFTILTLIGFALSIPTIAMFYGLHEWTQDAFGFGARTIAIIDTGVSGPFYHLAMIPMLALIAFFAPEKRRATWFALIASLMNLALSASRLTTKYINQIWTIDRGQYDEVGTIMIVVSGIGLVLPLAAIWVFLSREQKTQKLS